MFKRKNRKGFTIVELVIVIAVIGILAAILIPTFVSLNDKANRAADSTLIHNLNTALRIEEAQEGKNKTLHDAVEDLDDYGYKLANLVSKSGENLLWNQEKDEFVINRGEAEYNKQEYWEIRSNMPDPNTNKRSIYAGNGWTTENVDIKNGSGFDAGTHNVSSVSYSREYDAEKDGTAPHDVVIRTNGGTLTVDAENDTVRHYGEAQVVTLTAVADHSYYEHGSVNLVDVKKGRLVITNDAEAEVGTIYLTATDDAYDGIILATQTGATLPETIARQDVTIESGKKLVAVVQQVNAEGVADEAKTENIYLYAASTAYEETKGYTGVSELGTLVLEAPTDNATFTITVKDGDSEREVTVTVADLDESVTEEKTTTLEEVVAAATEFAGGKGTEASPWLIVDYDTMQAISNHYNDDVQRYFKVKDGITEIDCSNWNPVKLYGHFDGNGVTFKNVDDILFSSIYQNASSDETAVIKNFSIEAYIVRSSYASALAYSVGEKVDFSNINVNGYIEGSYTASFVSFGPWQFDGLNTATWTFNNCNSSAMLCGTDGAAGFVNHSFCAVGSTAHLVNSKFTGEMRLVKKVNTTSKNDYYGGTDGHITGEINAYNAAYYFQCMSNLVFTEEFTDGTDVNTLHYNRWASKTTQGTAQSDVLCIRDRVSLAPLTEIDQLNTNGVSTVTVNATNNSVTHAKAVLYIGPNDAENETGGYYSAWHTEELALNNGQFTTNTIKTFKIAINGLFYDWTDNTWKEPEAITDKNTSGIYGDYYNMALSSFYGRTYAQKSVTIIQYNSLNQVVSKTSVNFAVSTSLNVYDYTGNLFNGTSVKSITADKRAVLGMSYSLVLQDPTLTAEELVVKHGSDVFVANTDYTVENGVLNIKASAIKQSTYKERNITVNRKLNVTLNDEEQDSILNQVTCYINIAGLTTTNKSGLTVKINNVVITEGSGRYTVEKGRIKVDAKVLTGDVDITFSIPE